jgi:protein gp37
MAYNTGIEWTESTWNPTTGCTKISPGCQNCYAERLAKRLQAMGQINYINGFNLTVHKKSIEIPLKWKKPQLIFVNSMSDLFHKDVPFGFIKDVFDIMHNCKHHIFQILTKRSKRLLDLSTKLNWPQNVWMGVSVENNNYINRIEHLRQIDAQIKFISFEPLLSQIDVALLDLSKINWVIVGGESGPKARSIEEVWITDIRDKCIQDNVPFFFKQWGGFFKKKHGRVLQGETWEQMPNTIVHGTVPYSVLTLLRPCKP